MARRPLALALLLAASAGASLAAAPRAQACGAVCASGALLPASGGLPANALQLLWRRSHTLVPQPADGALRIYKVEGGQRSELPFTTSPVGDSISLFRVTIGASLSAGTELVIEETEVCMAQPELVTTSLRVTPGAPAPTSLGKLELEGAGRAPLDVWVYSGECYASFDAAHATVRVALSDAARPYADALNYGVRVDGELYGGQEAPASWRGGGRLPLGGGAAGRGKARLYHLCEAPDGGASPGLAAGKHRVQLFAELPDGRSIESDEITVELSCDAAPPDAGTSDAGPSDAGADAQPIVWTEVPPAPMAEAGAPDAASDSAVVAGPDAAGTAHQIDYVVPPAQRASAQCAPLIGARAGRSVLWATFVALLLIVCGRTKRRQRLLGSARQGGGSPQKTPAPRG